MSNGATFQNKQRQIAFSITLFALLNPVCLVYAENNCKQKDFITITNEKYKNDCFWGGPKGLDYGLLKGAEPIQQPILYPDQGSTYFVAQFKLPPKSYLKIEGNYPHERYFSFTMGKWVEAGEEQDSVIGGGDNLRDEDIVANEGSINPFVKTNQRDIDDDKRKYTVYIKNRHEDTDDHFNSDNVIEIDRFHKNPNEGEMKGFVHFSMRNYIADNCYDGTGNAKLDEETNGLPKVTLHYLDGSPFEDMCKELEASKAGEPIGYSVDLWNELVLGDICKKGDMSAPAEIVPRFELFWNVDYSVTGKFEPNQIVRVQKHPPLDDGGFAQNPDTKYLWSQLSLQHGEVYVVEGKMPMYTKTKDGNKNWNPDEQVRYWSFCTGGAPPSGAGWDCVFDEEVPLRGDRKYKLVISRKKDRPANANKLCGFKWVDFGEGESGLIPRYTYKDSRNWISTVYMRFMQSSQSWDNSPSKVHEPTLKDPYPHESIVMGEYFPVISGTFTKEDFAKKYKCEKP